jgi:leader peptidase (prepilin peptidase)/N-methyltransferase
MCAGFLATDSLLLLCYLVFISFVVCLIVIDFNTFLLPDELTLLLLWLGLLVNIKGLVAIDLMSSVIGAMVGYVSLWLLYWIFKLITKREGMGYGDFKFLAAILAWFGYQAFIPVLLIAPMLAIIYFIILRLLHQLKLDQPIPFGPFLGIAALVLLCINRTGFLNYFQLYP